MFIQRYWIYLNAFKIKVSRSRCQNKSSEFLKLIFKHIKTFHLFFHYNLLNIRNFIRITRTTSPISFYGDTVIHIAVFERQKEPHSILWETEWATHHFMWDTKSHVAFMRDWRNLIEFYEKWMEPRCILQRQKEPRSIQWETDGILWKKAVFNQIVSTAALPFIKFLWCSV